MNETIDHGFALNLRKKSVLGAVLECFFVSFFPLFSGFVGTDGDVGSRSHGDCSGWSFTDEQASLAVFVVKIDSRVSGSGESVGLQTIGDGGGPVGFVSSRKNAVLDVESGVNVFAGGAGASFEETFLKVVAQKCIKNGIHGAVGVAQETSEKKARDTYARLALFGWCKNKSNLSEPIRKPAKDVNCDDCKHEFRYFLVGAFFFSRLVFRSDRLKFSNNEEIENEDEDEGYREAKNKRIEGKSCLPTVIVWPVNIAAHTTSSFPGICVQKNRNHKECASGPGG